MSFALNQGPAREALLAYAPIVCNPDEAARCSAWLGLTDASENLQRTLGRELALHDLSEDGFSLLAQLTLCEPNAVRPDDLGPALGLGRTATANLLGRLEVSGLILHERAGREQPESGLRLTAAGRKIFTQALKSHLAAILHAMSTLDSADITLIDRTCKRLRPPLPSAPTL
ncbi:MAG TPA: MarR family winged helix-turn-helix transcriptional regulator [Opitutaceae bacterium]